MASRATIRRRRVTALALLAAAFLGTAWIAGADAPVRRAFGVTGGRSETITIHSRALRRPMHATVLLPHGDLTGRPLVVDLHGKGKAAPKAADYAGGDDPLAALGSRAPIVVLVSDDGDSYWHDRATGAWDAYIVNDVIPQVQRRYVAGPYVALTGLSMGGSGALAVALSHPGRFCAVVASSPALWEEGGLSAPGAYDDAEDYAAHNPFALLAANPSALRASPVWIDIGDRDPFLGAARAFALAAKRTPANVRFSVEPGGHDGEFWHSRYPRYLQWVSAQLTHCREPHSVPTDG